MARGLLSTDYSHQSFDDMQGDLHDWIDFMHKTVNELNNRIDILHKNKYWQNVDQNFTILVNYSLTFFNTCINEITSVLKEMQSEIRRDHFKRLRHIGDKAKELNYNFGRVWHREEWDLNKEYGKEEFKIVESIYADARDLAISMQDVQRLAIRLKDFIGKKSIINMNTAFSVEDKETILNSLWVLDSEKADGSKIIQGTGFSLKNIGVITCSHVLSDQICAYKPSDLSKKFGVKILKNNPDLDIAVLEIDTIDSNSLQIGNSDEVNVLDVMVLSGFPNFNYGDSGIIKTGKICGFRPKSGVKRFLIDTSIIGGNSGGPVLDKNLKVIGVAVTGSDCTENADKTENHGVIPINVLKLL